MNVALRLINTGEATWCRIGGVRYIRRLNDVGVIECVVVGERVTEWIERGCLLALPFFGRVENVYRLMDYERNRNGRLRIYGEDMMYLLRDSVLRAPAETPQSRSTGDAGAAMCAIARTWQTQTTIAAQGALGCVVTEYVQPTVNVDVAHAWSTPLEAMREIAGVARQSGYRLWFGAVGQSAWPLRWSLEIRAHVWGVVRARHLAAQVETLRLSDERSLIVALGRGVGESRAIATPRSARAMWHRLDYREGRRDARQSADVVAEGAQELASRTRRVDVGDPVAVSRLYPREVDLGDAVVARGITSSDVMWVTGVVVSFGERGVRVELEAEDVK